MEEMNTMTEKKGPAWLIWVLVIVVVVLIVAFAMKKDDTVSETFDDIGDKIAECQASLSAWNEMHPEGSVLTDEEQDELAELLEECGEYVEAAQESL